MKEVNQISLATDRPVISPHSYECMSVQLIFLASLRPVHVSSRSRHPRARLHNTSLYAATVRRTLIIYLLQFCLFSSIFHNSSPRHPSRSPYRTAAEKKASCVCVSDALVFSTAGTAAHARRGGRVLRAPRRNN